MSVLKVKTIFYLGDEWLMLNRLVANAGFTMLFDLNTLIRFENGSWNFLNGEDLIEFSDKHNLDVIWELGNGTINFFFFL